VTIARPLEYGFPVHVGRAAPVLDTVHLVTPGVLAEAVARRLTGVEERWRQGADAPHFTGRLGTLRASLSPHRLTVRGSLARFTGRATPSRADVAAAVEEVACVAGVTPERVEVWRMDVFADLTLNEPPAAYFPLLVTCPRLQRVEHAGTSAGFQCARRDVRFYDRAARDARSYRPCGGPLRYEVAWKKDLSRQFDGPVSGRRLADRALWDLAVSKWLAEYAAIEKARQALPFDGGGVAFTRALAVGGVQLHGISFLLDSVEQEHRAGRITRRAWQDRRRQVLDLASDPRHTRTPARLIELDAAVEAAGERMRALAAT